jgi:hypothetical protein
MKKNIFLFFAIISSYTNLNGQTWFDFYNDSLLTVEASYLSNPEIKEWAYRNGDTLSIKMDDQSIKTFTNLKEPMYQFDSMDERMDSAIIIENYDDDNMKNDTLFHIISYRFLQPVCSGKYYMIEMYENGVGGGSSLTYLIINKTNGVTLDINTYPIFSSDSSRFIITHGCEPSDDVILGVTVYKTTEKQFIKEFYIQDKKYEYSDVNWISTIEFAIQRTNYETKKTLSPLKYKWNGSKWILGK